MKQLYFGQTILGRIVNQLGRGMKSTTQSSASSKTFDITDSSTSYSGKVLKMVRSKKNLRVAIIGRENVGKSTLFNSLLGRQHSIVHNSPGVTRDCQEAKTQIKLKYPMNVSEIVFEKKSKKRLIKKISCTFIDTPGANFMESIIQQTQNSIASSNIALLVTDCRDGLQKWDYHVANYLEMKGIPALHILNKCDGPLMRGDSDELEEVISKNTIPSLGKPIPISSEMKIGMDQIVSVIQSYHFLTESLSEETLQKTRDELYQSVIDSIHQSYTASSTAGNGNGNRKDKNWISLDDDGIECEDEHDLMDDDDGHGNGNESTTVGGRHFQPGTFRGEWETLPTTTTHKKSTTTTGRDYFTETVKITNKDIQERLNKNTNNKPSHNNYRQQHQITTTTTPNSTNNRSTTQKTQNAAANEEEEDEEEFSYNEESEQQQQLVNSSGLKEDNTMRLAIIGRSNVGKSTMLNHLIGEERTRTSSTPGTTRDTIEVEAVNEKTGQHYLICDTAGIRKKKHTDTDRIEQMSLKDTYRTIKYANVCCLVVDPTHNINGEGYGLTQQDLDIARMVEKEGRALIIACNKWDLVKHPYVVAQQIESQIESSLSQMQGISVVVCSAKTGKNLTLLLKECEKAYKKWTSKISTHQLNTFIRQYLETKPIPQSYPKVRYISQVAIRPPTFCIHTSNKKFPTNFERQIVNAIRDEFELGGVPFRVIQKLNSKKNSSSGETKQ